MLPHSLHHPHHRVGGAVPVGEYFHVHQVDPRRLRIVSPVDEVDPVDDLLWDLLQQVVDQVGVGVDDYNGVVVPPRCLLPHLVQDDVLHQRGFAHAGAGHVEVVAARGVIGEVDLAGAASHRVPHVGAAGGGLADGYRTRAPGGAPWVAGPRPPGGAQGGQLPHAQDVATLEHPRHQRHRLSDGECGPDPAGLEPGPGGVVVALLG